MHDAVITQTEGAVTTLTLVFQDEAEAALAALGERRAFAEAQGFKGEAGKVLALPGEDAARGRLLAGLGVRDRLHPMTLRGLPARLPPGDYVAEGAVPAEDLILPWMLGAYVFDRYRRRQGEGRARLVVPPSAALDEAIRVAHACALARDLINTPANDMGPRQIETVAREIAEDHGATVTVTTGDALLEANYPAVHAVGRAATAERAPRIVEIGWRLERTNLPLVALVGKGVVFDTGGLNLKPGNGMRLMKKDMGGAAHALALARLVMQADLPVRLVVLVPAVENAVGSDSFRPGDVIASRKGLTIEIGNTDAEGRLILADALARAGEHSPDLTLDFATLTGAARVALGPEVIPFFTHDDALAAELSGAAQAVDDPLWRLPLWPGYREALEGDISDLKNDGADWAQAGSIIGALFLERFAPETGAWAHFDIYAWSPRSRPGFPAGGETQAIRAAYEVLKRRYGQAR
jgi:leucyl aminopeptidase